MVPETAIISLNRITNIRWKYNIKMVPKEKGLRGLHSSAA
jgi:hypothetical protein